MTIIDDPLLNAGRQLLERLAANQAANTTTEIETAKITQPEVETTAQIPEAAEAKLGDAAEKNAHPADCPCVFCREKREPKKQEFPQELAEQIKIGTVFRIPERDPNNWYANRCSKCKQFKSECDCGGSIESVPVAQREKITTKAGKQLAGLEPTPAPKTQEQVQQEVQSRLDDAPFMHKFSGADELTGDMTVEMLIEDILPVGTSLICGLPKEGKSYFAMSMTRALTTGKPMLGRYRVSQVTPVIYLAAESTDSALKLRVVKFGIPGDKKRFLARTLTRGPMFGLNDDDLAAAIRALHPVVILDTLIRFNEGSDEDSAAENRKLAEAIFQLIGLGARAVVGIHHSRKDLNKANPTKEAAVRGSGDGLAMVDCVWLVMQDSQLFNGGKGPNEIDLVGWGRDFNPSPMRLALDKKAGKLPAGTMTFRPGFISCVNAGDLEWVDQNKRDIQRLNFEQLVAQAVTDNPGVNIQELIDITKESEWNTRKVLKRLGYTRKKGDPEITKWEKKAA